MSEEQSIKTEKPTWSYPSSRQTPTAYNNPSTLEWVADVPAGKMPAGLIIDAKLTTVGAGMSLTRLSQIFKSIKVFGDGNLVADIDQYTLDLLPIALGWARHSDDYADIEIGQLDTGKYMVRDEINVATGASMYGLWDLNVALKAAKQIRIVVETYDMTAVFGSGMTGGIPSISVVPKWANAGKRKQYNLYARQLSSVLRAAYRGVEIGAFFKAAEWNTTSNGTKLGGDLSVEQIYAIQSNVGNTMCLWAQARGSQVNGRLTTILNPLDGADTYVIANKFDGQTAAEFAFTTAQTLSAIILSEAGPDKIEVQ
jgi:hypothetical protein